MSVEVTRGWFTYAEKPPLIGSLVSSDNFNRADESPISGNWTQHDDNAGTGRLIISSKSVTFGVTNGDDLSAFWNTWTSGDDQYSQASVTGGSTSAGTGPGVCVRRSTTAATVTYYRAVVDTGGNYEVGKLVTGSFTSIRTGTVTYVAGRKIGLNIRGTTLRLFYDGVQIGADMTDTSIASGSPGIAYSSSEPSFTIDNWDAGTVP